jgi:hypothetical protein
MKLNWKLRICALALTVITGSGVAFAQPAQRATQAAQSWLALVDAGEYGRSWNDVAQYLKKRIAKSQWVAQLQQARTPLGAVKSRKLASAQLKNAPPGLPAGQYAEVRYTTTFEKVPMSTEVVAMVLEQGGWHVMAYVPRARIVAQSK